MAMEPTTASGSNLNGLTLICPGMKSHKVASMGKRSKEGVMALIQSIILEEREDAGEPFYVMDVGTLVGLWDKWVTCLPMIRPFYAVKCNPDPAILGVLAALGAGFDCASRAEIEAVLSLGVSADRIVYANPCKAKSHIRYSAQTGVNLTTFDSKEELEKLRKCHQNTAALLRLKVPEDGYARSPLGSKYGALPEEVCPLLEAARAAGISVVGVSFHVGSGATSGAAYGGAIAAARQVFNMALEVGLPRMRVLNIGGGFTVGLQFDEAAATIGAALPLYFPEEPGLTVMAEPGRFFAETTFILATNIIGKRVRNQVREYWINDGIYGSMNCLLNDQAIITALPLALASSRANPTCKGMKTYVSTVFGPTCDALDTVLTGHQLPELQLDDWLVLPNMGAYAASTGSSFNGFATSAIRTHLAYSYPT